MGVCVFSDTQCGRCLNYTRTLVLVGIPRLGQLFRTKSNAEEILIADDDLMC